MPFCKLIFFPSIRNVHQIFHSVNRIQNYIQVISSRCLYTATIKYNDNTENEQSVLIKNETFSSEEINDLLQAENKSLSKNIQSFSALSTKVDDVFLRSIAPEIGKSFTLAHYANDSVVLQKLVKLGVDLSKVEKSQCSEFLLRADFDKDLKQHIFFLNRNGVPKTELGHFITKNPLIFQEDLDHLEVRIKYLMMKKFTKKSIARIITSAPKFLMFDTLQLDQQLGFIQKLFGLRSTELRKLTAQFPRLIIYNKQHIIENNFAIKEVMGFTDDEIKQLLLSNPKLWTLQNKALIERFDFLHNSMCVPHKQILLFPKILTLRLFKLQERHQYLVELGRAQYDPTKPGYVSLEDIAVGTDDQFSKNVAHTCVDDFNRFLKTL